LGVEVIYALGWFTGEGLIVNAWGLGTGEVIGMRKGLAEGCEGRGADLAWGGGGASRGSV